jgi:hypothetical protein
MNKEVVAQQSLSKKRSSEASNADIEGEKQSFFIVYTDDYSFLYST